jgi:hypothetical protein
MDFNVINGVARAVVPAAIAYLVGRGVLPSDTSSPDVTAAVITLIAALWSIKTNWKH